ncbi:MAG TPA: hypothetical protein VGN08_01970 [Solirubrobacteraceae bacterium]|jgi:hypothetical protein
MPREFTHFADRVRAMIRDGDTLVRIGREVDSWPLPEEQRSALWLLAWSSGARRPRAARTGAAPGRMRSAYPSVRHSARL